jgi:hypothetical protein
MQLENRRVHQEVAMCFTQCFMPMRRLLNELTYRYSDSLHD